VAGVLLILPDADLRCEVDGEPLTTVQSLAVIEFTGVGFAPKHVYRNIHRCTVARVGQQFLGLSQVAEAVQGRGRPGSGGRRSNATVRVR
jgi:hypothetical protein